VVRIKLARPDVEMLKVLPYVKDAYIKDGTVCISINDASHNLQDLLAHTGPIDYVEVRNGTLNDVFMHYTGREIREDETTGGQA
jgi:ABC-type uncharacterized transport system ATPase subunit